MAEFVRIREWSRFQHYKDRNPPWIKLHRELLSSRTWVELSDASRVLAIASMLLAAATDNKIPLSAGYIRRVAYLNQEPDFTQLLITQFVEIIDDNGKVLADASKVYQMRQNAVPETETETEKRQRESQRKSSAPKPRGPRPNTGMAKASGETRHTRLHGMIMEWYQEWAGTTCPWNGAEGKQLQNLLTATPGWLDPQFIDCLENLSKSPEYIPKGSSPHEWLSKLPKFLKGPLDRFGRPAESGNGNNKKSQYQDAAEMRRQRDQRRAEENNGKS